MPGPFFISVDIDFGKNLTANGGLIFVAQFTEKLNVEESGN